MFPKVARSAWTLVCKGELENESYWKPKYKALEQVQHIINSLEEVEGINWHDLIGSHSYFASLADANGPQEYSEQDYDDLFFGDFLFITPTDEKDNDADRPGASFTRFRLYVDADREDAVLSEFKTFLTHLRAHPVVQREMG